MIYDLIIIGAGAAGLFAGASLPSPVNGLIIEKNDKPGKKLLLSGAGQCNLTHGGSIKEFLPHYGKNGAKIRPLLYPFSNESVIRFFEAQGISFIEREDGKVFPESLQAQDILNVLMQCCLKKELKVQYSSPVTNITFEENRYIVHCGSKSYLTKKLLIATGGCSYPTTGSDGSLFPVLKSMGIKLEPLHPALVPIHVQDYPYQGLSGISFPKVKVTITQQASKIDLACPAVHEDSKKSKISKNPELTDALLFTHSCFSGPAVLNLSRYAVTGDKLSICYIPGKVVPSVEKEVQKLIQGNSKQLITVLSEHFTSFDLPRRFLEVICERCGVDYTKKASQTSGGAIHTILQMLVSDTYTISGLGGYHLAMATAGGVALSEINLKTMESVRYPNLFFAGEILDIDGDTGGYNLQFAFSSANLAARQI